MNSTIMPQTRESREPVLEYSLTNKHIESIIDGLDIEAQDRILAIGGSGDLAFAFLEHSERVIVVDKNPAQIEYIKQRVEALRSGDLQTFLSKVDSGKFDDYGGHANSSRKARDAYFNAGDRIERIRSKLSDMEVKDPMDIFEAAIEARFNKVYLSRAATYTGDFMEEGFVELVKQLPLLGLLCTTDHESRLFIDQIFAEKSSIGLFEDQERTDTSRKYAWSSNTVYRKMGPW